MSISLYEAFEARPDRLAFARVAANRLLCGTALLEIGCGDGIAAEFFSEQGINVTAVDIKHCSFQRNGVSFVQADAAKLPFVSESFDCVYCEAAFSSVVNKVSASEEIYRVLRTGGQLILIDYVLKEKSIENASTAPSLKGAGTEAEYMDLFGRLHLLESKDEAAFLVSLMLHLCHTYSISYEDLVRFLDVGRTEYGFKTFIYTK